MFPGLAQQWIDSQKNYRVCFDEVRPDEHPEIYLSGDARAQPHPALVPPHFWSRTVCVFDDLRSATQHFKNRMMVMKSEQPPLSYVRNVLLEQRIAGRWFVIQGEPLETKQPDSDTMGPGDMGVRNALTLDPNTYGAIK